MENSRHIPPGWASCSFRLLTKIWPFRLIYPKLLAVVYEAQCPGSAESPPVPQRPRKCSMTTQVSVEKSLRTRVLVQSFNCADGRLRVRQGRGLAQVQTVNPMALVKLEPWTPYSYRPGLSIEFFTSWQRYSLHSLIYSLDNCSLSEI